eukprot:c25972_g2_i1 orf=156-2045(+)
MRRFFTMTSLCNRRCLFPVVSFSSATDLACQPIGWPCRPAVPVAAVCRMATMRVVNGPFCGRLRVKGALDCNCACESVMFGAVDGFCVGNYRVGRLKSVEGLFVSRGHARMAYGAFCFPTVGFPERQGNGQDFNEVRDTEGGEDSDEESVRRRRQPEICDPEVVEFATKEGEKLYHELLSFPWRREGADRKLAGPEKKSFPKHGMDSSLNKRHVRHSTENIVVGAQSSSKQRSNERFDQPRLAKSLSSGITSKEISRTQQSISGAAQRRIHSRGIWFRGHSNESQAHDYRIQSSSTIRAPLGSEKLASHCDSIDDKENTRTAEALVASKDAENLEELKKIDLHSSIGLTGLKTVSDVSKTELKEAFISVKGGYGSGTEKVQGTSALKAVAKPLVLKQHMKVPEKWDGPQGTVVLIDKPKGWSSFAVCEKIRNLVRVQKVGHAGTLDPLATGLLVVCVGRATKLADSYQGLPKVYTGILRLGESTPSGDAASQVNETKPWEHLTDDDIQQAKEAFIGDILQIPPMFSAIKVQGERLYKKARRGEELNIPARKISIYEFEIDRSKESRQNIYFRVSCSKGTYVRSLCADFGRALNSCAYMMELRRQKIGAFSVKEAWDYSELADEYSDHFH